jgi:hypothetical protein
MCLFTLSVFAVVSGVDAAPAGGAEGDTVALKTDSSISRAMTGLSHLSARDASIQEDRRISSLAFREVQIEPLVSFQTDIAMTADSAQADSLHHAMVHRLLPPHLSLLESGLWGENGILRSTGLAGPLTAESRKRELSLRRAMLTVHQVGGFLTLGLMGTTVYFGQMALDNPRTRSYRETHSDFVTATILSYSLTGALALLSPPPLIRRDEISTTSIHKTLAWIHVAGMILTPILGASLHHSMNYDQRARFHQISAYVTTATFAASMIVVTF